MGVGVGGAGSAVGWLGSRPRCKSDMLRQRLAGQCEGVKERPLPVEYHGF